MTMLRILLLLCFASYTVVDSALIGGPRVIYDGTVGEDGETINMNHELFDKIKTEVVFHFNRVYFTAKSCSGKCNPDVYHTIFHVKKITSQVVAGVKYGVDFSLLPTKCHTSNTTRKLKTFSECRPVVGQVPQLCHAEIWEKSWLRMFKTTNMTCVPEILLLHRSVRSVSSHRHAVEVGSYSEFLAFKATHGKIYTPVEQLKRFRIFRENMQKAHVLTQLELGSGRYGASPYADMTETEFRSTRLTPIWDQSKMPETPAKPATQAAPTAFDWRKHNAVTAVKNQGSCGSCWAFSTTGNVEGQWAIQKKKLLSLSEQELVDCDKVDQGCSGGLPSNAYKAIMKLGGLELESEYPYEGRNDKCKFDKADVRATVNGSVALPQDEGKLAAWLAQNGPISIGINAFAMQFYMGGISHPWSFLCNPAHLDHGVLLVGYGVQGTEPYWIVKNSWGPSWGEQGYYLVYRGGGVCGLNRMATSAVVN